MNELIQRVESAFSPQNWINVRTLVAVSGGPDSVAVLRALVTIGQQFGQWKPGNMIVAHVNHGTRGPDSTEDALFVCNLAGQLGLEFMQADVDMAQMPEDSEESLRRVRYQQLIEMSLRCGARYIVMGHNLDDQVETILFRIFRGTGIGGLTGIPRQRLANESITIVRPLLDVSRQLICSYLNEIGQDYQVDCSNADSKYTRNFLRHEVIPTLKKKFGNSISESILRLSRQAHEVDQFLLGQTQVLSNAIERRHLCEIVFNCDRLLDHDPLIIRRWLAQIWVEQNWPRQAMTFRWWQQLCAALQSSQDVVLNLPCSIRFEKTDKIAVLTDLRNGNGEGNGEPTDSK